MMKFYCVLGIIGVLLHGAVCAYAEEKKWGNQTELSYVETTGNTEVTTLSAKNLLTYKFSETLNAEWEAGALTGRGDGKRNAERYYTELRGSYLITERFYSLLITGWEKDSFAGIDARYYIGPGVGYKLVTGPKHILFSEAGVDYVSEEYIDETDDDYVRGRLFGKYEYLFTEKSRFMQSVEYLHDFEENDNYRVNSVTSLTSALSDYLSMKATYEVRYVNEPVPMTLDDTDTVLTVALVINI